MSDFRLDQELADELLLSAEAEVDSAALESAAEEADSEDEVAAGASLLAPVAGASCFVQAISVSAATSAPRASLVFIDRLPRREAEWCEKNEFLSFRESLNRSRCQIL